MGHARLARELLPAGIALALLAASCGRPGPTPSATPAATTAAIAPASPTSTRPAPTGTPATPRIGGTLVVALSQEPDSLNPQASAMTSAVTDHIGASLVAEDPQTGRYVGYLAESWTTSQDGLTWTFHLKKGIRFHDGTPFSASDYEWTFEQLRQTAGDVIPMLESAEAVDDSTLRLQLGQPYFPILYALSLRSYAQPMSRSAFERLGDQLGRQPVGVGPWKFKEWQTGEKIVLERNPEYAWGPDFNKGGPYIQAIEFRIIPEYSTALAGLETGEIDFFTPIAARDVSRLKALPGMSVQQTVQAGLSPIIHLNAGRPPFDDLRVRQAFNLAVDRQALIAVAAQKEAVEQRGPLSPGMSGYWPGIESLGYGYDLPRAKALMLEAGYVASADGSLTKDGSALSVSLQTPSVEWMAKVAEVLQQQYKALGVAIDIQAIETSACLVNLGIGNYDMQLQSHLYEDPDVLTVLLGSNSIGGFNVARIEDADLDALLSASRAAVDSDQRQQTLIAVQKRLVEQALLIPLYAPKIYSALSTRVKGAILSPGTHGLWLADASIADK